jgi:hypothetical protein
MVSLSFVPNWFLGYGLIFELAFAVITLAVSIYSFKIYKLSGQRQSKIFGAAFLFFSLSYFIQLFINLSIIAELNERIMSVIEFQNLVTLNSLAIFSHMIFFTLGLVTLSYMILNVKSKPVYIVMMVLSVGFILLSADKINFFYILSSLLLIVISAHYLKNYLEKKHSRTILIMVAFIFLLFGHIHFIFLVNHEVYFVIGNFLELVAYTLILINLLKVLKK